VTLVEKYQETWVTVTQRLSDLAFLSLVEALFGPGGADDAERMLASLRARGGR
jgi:hypothetical protein